MNLTILILLLGILYGFSKRGYLNVTNNLKRSLTIGAVISFSLSLLLLLLASYLRGITGIFASLLAFGTLIGLLLITLIWSVTFSLGTVIGIKLKEFRINPMYILTTLFALIFLSFLLTFTFLHALIGTIVVGGIFYLIYSPNLPKIHLDYFEDRRVILGILGIFATALMVMYLGHFGPFATFPSGYCTDWDMSPDYPTGLNYGTKGQIFSTDNPNGLTDTCVDNNLKPVYSSSKLREYFCYSSSTHWIYTSCSCRDGHCTDVVSPRIELVSASAYQDQGQKTPTIVGSVELMNRGSTMPEGLFLWEMQIVPHGHGPYEAVTPTFSICDSNHPENVHKSLVLNPGRNYNWLSSQVKPGTYDVWFLFIDKCWGDEPKGNTQYLPPKFVGTVTVYSFNCINDAECGATKIKRYCQSDNQIKIITETPFCLNPSTSQSKCDSKSVTTYENCPQNTVCKDGKCVMPTTSTTSTSTTTTSSTTTTHPTECENGQTKCKTILTPGALHDAQYECVNGHWVYEKTCSLGCANQYVCVGEPSTTTTTRPTQCSDSDNGNNIYTKGTCRDNYGSYGDTCNGNSIITEYFCSGGRCNSDAVFCPAGYICSGGACVGGGSSSTTTTSTTTTIKQDCNALCVGRNYDWGVSCSINNLASGTKEFISGYNCCCGNFATTTTSSTTTSTTSPTTTTTLCTPGATNPCTTAQGTIGTKTCINGQWSACVEKTDYTPYIIAGIILISTVSLLLYLSKRK